MPALEPERLSRVVSLGRIWGRSDGCSCRPGVVREGWMCPLANGEVLVLFHTGTWFRNPAGGVKGRITMATLAMLFWGVA